MDENMRPIIAEVVEETPMGNPVAINFIDPFARCVNYRRLLVYPRLQGNTQEDCEIVCETWCMN